MAADYENDSAMSDAEFYLRDAMQELSPAPCSSGRRVRAYKDRRVAAIIPGGRVLLPVGLATPLYSLLRRAWEYHGQSSGVPFLGGGTPGSIAGAPCRGGIILSAGSAACAGGGGGSASMVGASMKRRCESGLGCRSLLLASAASVPLDVASSLGTYPRGGGRHVRPVS
jgi:hypothetical protein